MSGQSPLKHEPLVGKATPERPWPVEAKNLLTERERSLYQSLNKLYPNHKIFVQVALSQLIDIDSRHPERNSIRARFKQLVADFVLCRADLSLVAVIELDDRTHERAVRQAADARKNKVLADAGIRLVRIPAGPLPSEDFLRTLIDADGTTHASPEAETVLALAEDDYPPASSYDSDEAGAVEQEFKRIAKKGVALVILLLVGWLFYGFLLPALIKRAFAPLANVTARTAVVPPKALMSSVPSASAPVLPGRIAEDAEAKRAHMQETSALAKEKNLAWAAFYSAPASCEHPVDWNAQVECGNQYMRAKRAFEQNWTVEHSSSQGNGAAVILDGRSVAGGQK